MHCIEKRVGNSHSFACNYIIGQKLSNGVTRCNALIMEVPLQVNGFHIVIIIAEGMSVAEHESYESFRLLDLF